MKRRWFVQAIPFLSASPALFAQAITKLDTASTDSVGKPLPRFFSAPQLAALRRLSDLIAPAVGDMPGALDAGAPEFLDFLVGESPKNMQMLYRSGLDTLNSSATAKYGRSFAALDAIQADAVLDPLREAWTWKEPTDPFANFLRHAKADVLTATANSHEWVIAAQRGRGGGGNGTYWLPAE